VSASLRLVLMMLKVALVDGPREYGGIANAIEDIQRTLTLNGEDSISLGKVDSILRENNVDVGKIEAAYVGHD
jgi:hypothetical protein